MKNNKLLVLGTMAFDEIITPSIVSGKILGGAATYIGLSASPSDAEIGIISVVGDDFPERYISLLTKRGIDVRGVTKIKGQKSFYWKGRYRENMNLRDTLETQVNVLADFEPKVPINFKDASVVMLGNLDPIIQKKVLDQLSPNSERLVLLDTMNFWMNSELAVLMSVVGRADIIVINHEEALQLSGESSLALAAKAIHKLGPSFVIIKKGEHGALLFHHDEAFFAPALPLDQVVDPTGAGDSFAGGLSGYLAEQNQFSTKAIKEGILRGTAAASICVCGIGTKELEVANKDIFISRLKRIEKLRSIS